MNYFMLKGMRDELEKIALGASLYGPAFEKAIGSAYKGLAHAAPAINEAHTMSRVEEALAKGMRHKNLSLTPRGAHPLAPAALAEQAAETSGKTVAEKSPGFFAGLKNKILGKGTSVSQHPSVVRAPSPSMIPSPA